MKGKTQGIREAVRALRGIPIALLGRPFLLANFAKRAERAEQ